MHCKKDPKHRRYFSVGVLLCLLTSIFFSLYYYTSDKFQKEYPSGALTQTTNFDRLVVEKKKRLLTAYDKGRPVRIYSISLGESPIGHKQFQGDMKTPEGLYTINDKNPHSAYYKNLGISYPNEKDRKFAKNKGKSSGGDIKIHGLAPYFSQIGSLHLVYDWTQGCIAITNDEIDELYSRTPLGTPIEILP